MRIWFLAVMVVPLLSGVAHAETPSYPALFFSYSRLYDGVCSKVPESQIQPEWAQEAFERTSEFVQMWQEQGPLLLEKLIQEFNFGFSRKEMTVTLSVCPKVPSFSNPLVLNVSKFLKSYMGERPTRGQIDFVNLLFHELLHTWLVENLKFPSPLIEKYWGEQPIVRSHMHLMALQIYIYTQMGRTDLLKLIQTDYPKSIDAGYVRAWEIVTKIEGYEAFIKELKTQ